MDRSKHTLLRRSGKATTAGAVVTATVLALSAPGASAAPAIDPANVAFGYTDKTGTELLAVTPDIAPAQYSELAPGRHSLRVRIPWRDPDAAGVAGNAAVAISNQVQIEVPPTKPDPVALSCTPGPGRHAEEFHGSLKRGDTFTETSATGWILRLVPERIRENGRESAYGWMLQVSMVGREREDLARLTLPLHGGNDTDISGWDLRNADNTGPNDGSVNRPGELREFIFSPAVGREIKVSDSISEADVEKVRSFGQGWLFIDAYQLTPPQKGQQAAFESMVFRACITWPAS